MSEDDARASAMRAFGNPALLREQTRAAWSFGWLESLLRDVRYGVRGLARAPGFATIAVLVMALGIGANVALFTIVRSVLLSPLPYRDSDRLVSVYEHEAKNNDERRIYLPIDAGSFMEWQQATQGVAEMALISPWQEYNVSAEGGRLPEKIDAAWCSWNFFEALGVQPALGRGFSASDDSPKAPATVMLTHSFWKRRYSGDPSIVGKSIWLECEAIHCYRRASANFCLCGRFRRQHCAGVDASESRSATFIFCVHSVPTISWPLHVSLPACPKRSSSRISNALTEATFMPAMRDWLFTILSPSARCWTMWSTTTRLPSTPC